VNASLVFSHKKDVINYVLSVAVFIRVLTCSN